jgi:hypothetical protein
MTQVHVLVQQTVRQSDVPKDVVDHTLAFTADQASVGGAEYQHLADWVRDVFSGEHSTGTSPWTRYLGRGLRVLVYDHSDPKPRPERAVSVYTPSTWESAPLGPRQVACCLSFYSGRNLPSLRGRTYLGPFSVSDLGETVPNSLRLSIMDLAQRLFAGQPSGTSVQWAQQVFSQKQGVFHPVTNYWANDVWDTMRSRLAKETLRVRYP